MRRVCTRWVFGPTTAAVTVVATILWQSQPCEARPGFNVEVIREKIGAENAGWCDLERVRRVGWFSTTFDLNGCLHVNGTGRPLSDSEAIELAEALGNADSVTVLTLASSGLSSVGAGALLKRVSTHGSLVGLILNDNNIDSSVADDLANLLRVNTKLAVLDLSHNDLGIDGIMDVLLALEENKGLVVLSLEGNDMHQQPAVVRPGNEGGVARGFSGLLHERTDLRVLRVGATGINLAGVHLIMSALEENDHLMEFEIGFKNIGHAGAEMIADALRKNRVLRRLIIDGSGITDDGAAEIAHALTGNTVLQELSVMSNALTSAAAKYFADALENGANALIELNLGYHSHGVSAEWWHHIQGLLQCNANAHDGNVTAVDCKETLIELEEARVCDIVTANNLECRKFLANRVTTVGDLLDLDEKQCAALVADVEISHERLVDRVASCLAARSTAKRNERRFSKDATEL